MLNKSLVIVLSVLFLIIACRNRVSYRLINVKADKRKEIRMHDIQLAKKILSKDCKEDKNPERNFNGSVTSSKQYGNHRVDGLTFIPISLFEIGKGILNHPSDITEFLEWKRGRILGFYTFDKDKFEGLLDWSPMIHSNFKVECFYFTIHNDASISDFPLTNGINYLIENKRDTSFLFGVKYVNETLWFIENERVYLLDLKNLNVYDPDEYIQLKCGNKFIQKISDGGQFRCS